jgi:choline-sulfatase
MPRLPSGKNIALGGLLGGLLAGLLDGAQAALRMGVDAGSVLATAALAGAVDLLLGAALGAAVGLTVFLARWGRAAPASPLGALVAWAVVGLGTAGVTAAAILGTAGRHNRFLAAGVVALDTLLAALVGALVAPALARLISTRRRARARAAADLEHQARPTPAGLLLLAPLSALVLDALIFVLVSRTRVPLSTADRSTRMALAGALAGVLPFVLAFASTRARRLPGRRAAAAAGLIFVLPAGAFVWLNWTQHFQFMPWADVRALALVVTASLGFSLWLPGRAPHGWRLWAVLLAAPPAAVALALATGASEPARKAASNQGGLVGPALTLVRPLLDFDGDGYPGLLGGGDCDDRDPTINPGAQDWPDDGIDQDCDGHDLSAQALRSPPLHPVPDSIPADLNVIFIVIDTLRADRLGAYGYKRDTSPQMDRLAADGIVFENGWAHAPSTRYSLPAIVTGRWPSAIRWDHSIWWPRIAPDQRTIAEAMQDLGYLTAAFYAYLYFNRSDARGFERGVDVYQDHRAALHVNKLEAGPAESVGSSAREMADDAIAFLDEHKDKKFFLTLHFYDPHLDYQRHPDTPPFGSSQSDLYDGEVWFTDKQVGRVIAHLKRLGLYDKTVVFITGDHGEGLGERGIVAHGYHLYAPQTKVPFIARVPGLAPRRVKDPVGHVDIAPTFVNLARGPHEKSFLGRSMLDLMTGAPGAAPAPRFVFQEVSFEPSVPGTSSTERRGLATATHHLLWNWVPENTTACFDLVADPTETRDLWGTRAGEPVCSALKAELRRWVALLRLPPDFHEKMASAVTPPGTPAPAPGHAREARLGDAIRFLGYDLSAERVSRGQTVQVVAHFEVLAPLEGGWRLFTHLQGPGGSFRNLDHPPLEGAFPIDRWRPGHRLRDRVAITFAPNDPPGLYEIYVGFWRNTERLPVSPPEAQDGQNRLRVATINVE